MEHNNAIEKIGIGLVCSLEIFKGAKIEFVKRLSGFNVSCQYINKLGKLAEEYFYHIRTYIEKLLRK